MVIHITKIIWLVVTLHNLSSTKTLPGGWFEKLTFFKALLFVKVNNVTLGKRKRKKKSSKKLKTFSLIYNLSLYGNVFLLKKNLHDEMFED